MVTGLLLQAGGLAWLARVTTVHAAYSTLLAAFVVSGVGMALFFVPLATLVLSSVRRDEEGVASGTNSAFRELGGVLGIAASGALLAARGGYVSGPVYVHGLVPVVWAGPAVVALGALAAFALPRRRPAEVSGPARLALVEAAGGR